MADLPISLATALAPSPFKSTIATLAPSSAKRRAISRPKPEAAPVTIADLSCSRMVRVLDAGVICDAVQLARLLEFLPGDESRPFEGAPQCLSCVAFLVHF